MAIDLLLPWISSAGAGGVRHSMQTFAGDNTTGPFDFNFSGGYIHPTHVKAYRYDPDAATSHPLTLTLIGQSQAVSSEPIPVGQYIVLYRDTPKGEPLVDYTEGAVLDESNLDTTAQQAVFAAAEMVDRFDAVNLNNQEANDRSILALNTANTALGTATAAISDAATAVVTAGEASANASIATSTAYQAQATADAIDGKAQSALDNATLAASNANLALDTASAVDAKAQTALDNSTAAVGTANTAAATANAVDAKATQAQTDAADALAAVTGALVNKADAVHAHVWTEVTNPPTTATRWPKWDEVTEKPSTFAPAAHHHVIADVTGLQSALNGKANSNAALTSFTGNLPYSRIDGSPPAIGVGQTWQVVTRLNNTNYTNTTGKPIMFSLWKNVTSNNYGIVVYVDSLIAAGSSSFDNTNITIIIPNGATYKYTAAGGTIYVRELR